MWRLIARDRDGREVARVRVGPPGGEVVVGRDSQAEMHLPSVGVSRRHARIAVRGGELVIFDEGSANGVILDGRRIAGSAELRAGMLVQIAEFLIEIEWLGEDGARGAVVAAPHPEWRLQCIEGRLGGRIFELPHAGGVLGSASDADIVVRDDSIAPRHARLVPLDGALQIEDLGATGGITVGGARIQRARLEAGQQVRMGELAFVLQCAAASSTAYVGPAALRRTLLFVGAAAAVVGAVLLVLALVRGSSDEEADPDRRAAETAEHNERARAAIAARRWSDAADELGLTLVRDPLNTEARVLERRVAQEKRAERLMTTAAEALTRGGAEDLAQARVVLGQIPMTSVYRDQADAERKDIDKRLPSQLAREAEHECAGPEPSPRCHALVCAAAEMTDRTAEQLRQKYPKVRCP